jgi:hypothetical protein
MACAPSKAKLAGFKSNIPGNFTRITAGLPQGPKFDDSQRVSEFSGIVDFHNVYRSLTEPGLALIGDAALAADYIWGVGCGWALSVCGVVGRLYRQRVVRADGDLERGSSAKAQAHPALRGHFFMISTSPAAALSTHREALPPPASDAVSAEHFRQLRLAQIGLLRLLSPLRWGARLSSLTRWDGRV